MSESQSNNPEHQADVTESEGTELTRDAQTRDDDESSPPARSSLKDFGVFNLGVGILIALIPLYAFYSSYMTEKPIEQPALLAIPLVIGAVVIGLAVTILRRRSAWAIKLLMAGFALPSLAVFNSPRIGPMISTAVFLFLFIGTGVKALKELRQGATSNGE